MNQKVLIERRILIDAAKQYWINISPFLIIGNSMTLFNL